MSFKEECRYWANISDDSGVFFTNCAICSIEFFNPKAGSLSICGSIGPSSLKASHVDFVGSTGK